MAEMCGKADVTSISAKQIRILSPVAHANGARADCARAATRKKCVVAPRSFAADARDAES